MTRTALNRKKRKRQKPRKWAHILVRVVDQSPFVEETLWDHGDQGYELVAAYQQAGCVRLYFKKPVR